MSVCVRATPWHKPAVLLACVCAPRRRDTAELISVERLLVFLRCNKDWLKGDRCDRVADASINSSCSRFFFFRCSRLRAWPSATILDRRFQRNVRKNGSLRRKWTACLQSLFSSDLTLYSGLKCGGCSLTTHSKQLIFLLRFSIVNIDLITCNQIYWWMYTLV